jgi:hypothetical protein
LAGRANRINDRTFVRKFLAVSTQRASCRCRRCMSYVVYQPFRNQQFQSIGLKNELKAFAFYCRTPSPSLDALFIIQQPSRGSLAERST